MDLLTHLFLPIAIVYALRPQLFSSPMWFSLAGFAVLPDLDKLLGHSGALHSILTLGLLAAVMFALVDRLSVKREYATIAVLLLFSHLLLDIIDGGPVPLLFPLFDEGIGLVYQSSISLGSEPWVVSIRNLLPGIRIGLIDPNRTDFPLITGYGVLSLLTFITVYSVQTATGGSTTR